MKAVVNKSQRIAKMRAHSWAHLLNGQLDKVLNWTKQAGSFVDQDFIRFDFTTQKPLTEEQIKYIELEINKIISETIEIENFETSMEEAIKLWAKAFFEDKYWDKVRIVKIGDYSTELCGWTHANNTSEIGIFKIIWQEAVSAWTRRIIALTGPKVYEYITE